MEGWPEAIERRDLVRYFALDGEDLDFVREQRGAADRLGIALQLCSLRWLGFVPEDLADAPEDALVMLGAALDVAPRAIFDYAVRAPTRVEHRLAVREHGGYRAFSEAQLAQVGGRLVDAALEHERPSLVLLRVCEILRAERVERPSVDRLVRLVGWARERAHERTFAHLKAQLTAPVCGKLDALLVTEDGRCGHAWLRARPTSVSARALGRELEKRAFLIAEIGADRFDRGGCRRTGGRGWRRRGVSRPIRRCRGWRPSGAIRC